MEAARTGSYPKPLRRWGLWRQASSYFPARLHKTADLPPDTPCESCLSGLPILLPVVWIAHSSASHAHSRMRLVGQCVQTSLRSTPTASCLSRPG